MIILAMLRRCMKLFAYFSFFFYCSGDHRDLHSFPTRRSSDLLRELTEIADKTVKVELERSSGVGDVRIVGGLLRAVRSEEHTSELQSHHDLVCRLLLEKKKKNKKYIACTQSQR